jgi:hypothetical protein
MPASTVIGNMLLDCFVRGLVPVLPTQLFVALHTADPGVDGINEVTIANWPSYARQDSGLGSDVSLAWSPAANKVTFNSNRMEYGVMDGAAQLTVTHFALWDQLVLGQLYFYGPLLTPKSLAPTDECLINPDKLQVTVV